MGIDFWTTGKIVKGAEFVKHHHSEEHLPLPQHELERIFLATFPIIFVFALAEAPAINGKRYQAFFNANRGVGRLGVNTQQKLFLAESIHPAVPMDVKKTRSR